MKNSLNESSRRRNKERERESYSEIGKLRIKKRKKEGETKIKREGGSWYRIAPNSRARTTMLPIVLSRKSVEKSRYCSRPRTIQCGTRSNWIAHYHRHENKLTSATKRPSLKKKKTTVRCARRVGKSWIFDRTKPRAINTNYKMAINGKLQEDCFFSSHFTFRTAKRREEAFTYPQKINQWKIEEGSCNRSTTTLCQTVT